MEKRALKAAALLAVACFGLFAGGCGKDKAEIPRERVVAVIRAGGSPQEAAVGRFAATIRGRYETRMSFQVAGQINNRLVNVGDRVERGDVLLTIDPKDLGQRVREAEAAVNRAATLYGLAEANYNRYSALVEKGAVSRMAFDSYRTEYESASAALAAAEAQRAEADNALGYTELKADRDGVVADIQAEAGQVVAAGQNILTLVGTDELEAEINLPENRVSAVKAGDRALVFLWADDNDRKTEGTVREIAPMADSVSGTYRVRVAINQPPEKMALGMTASVELPGLDLEMSGETAGFSVPLSAVYQDSGSPQVWVVREGRTVRVPVKINAAFKDEVRISGIRAGEQVVVKGVHRLRDDEPVATRDYSEKKP